VGDVLGGARDRRVERVGDVLDDEADGAGAPVAQAAGEVVAGEAEVGDRRLHAGGGVGAHPRLAVDDARDRLEADARRAGDVAHGRPSHSLSLPCRVR
jgi:hypothetical protein